ncbi:MAG TPA: glycosyltransferase family 39 protein, partial [Opitutales bacterium]|nr:glycosyltransferase family 39 protein [Opitutales bacterium]
MRPTFLKLCLLFFFSAATLLLAWSLSDFAVLWSAGNLNYWFMAALFGAFLIAAFKALRGVDFMALKSKLLSEKWAIVLLLALSAFLQVNEPHRAKVLYDEDVICGVAYKMHEDRMAMYPARMHFCDGQLHVFTSAVDKRPVFFPFVLSTVHDLTGYRTANVFVLNAVLTFALLSALYYWVKPTAGPAGAAAAVLLLAGLPLLAQCATGAGFEVMNIFLIAAFALAGRRYLARQGSDGLDLFICVALMLASTRYESALYLFALAAIVLFKWIREKRVTMTWFFAVSPLFMFPSILCNRIFVSTDGFLQLKTEGAFFSMSYLHGNLDRALFYLFSAPGDNQTSSLLLSIVGVLSLTALAALTGSILSRRRKPNPDFPVLLPVLAVALVTSFISLINNSGQWDDPIIARYSLPLLLVMVMVFAAVLHFFVAYRTVRMLAPAVAAVWLVCFAAPQMARHEMTDILPCSQESAFMHKWQLENSTVQDLFVDQSALGIILAGRPAVAFSHANAAPWKLQAVLDAGLYQNVYVCER